MALGIVDHTVAIFIVPTLDDHLIVDFVDAGVVLIAALLDPTYPSPLRAWNSDLSLDWALYIMNHGVPEETCRNFFDALYETVDDALVDTPVDDMRVVVVMYPLELFKS